MIKIRERKSAKGLYDRRHIYSRINIINDGLDSTSAKSSQKTQQLMPIFEEKLVNLYNAEIDAQNAIDNYFNHANPSISDYNAIIKHVNDVSIMIKSLTDQELEVFIYTYNSDIEILQCLRAEQKIREIESRHKILPLEELVKDEDSSSTLSTIKAEMDSLATPYDFYTTKQYATVENLINANLLYKSGLTNTPNFTTGQDIGHIIRLGEQLTQIREYYIVCTTPTDDPNRNVSIELHALITQMLELPTEALLISNFGNDSTNFPSILNTLYTIRTQPEATEILRETLSAKYKQGEEEALKDKDMLIKTVLLEINGYQVNSRIRQTTLQFFGPQIFEQYKHQEKTSVTTVEETVKTEGKVQEMQPTPTPQEPVVKKEQTEQSFKQQINDLKTRLDTLEILEEDNDEVVEDDYTTVTHKSTKLKKYSTPTPEPFQDIPVEEKEEKEVTETTIYEPKNGQDWSSMPSLFENIEEDNKKCEEEKLKKQAEGWKFLGKDRKSEEKEEKTATKEENMGKTEQKTQKEQVKPKRTRRTKAEIEAQKAEERTKKQEIFDTIRNNINPNNRSNIQTEETTKEEIQPTQVVTTPEQEEIKVSQDTTRLRDGMTPEEILAKSHHRGQKSKVEKANIAWANEVLAKEAQEREQANIASTEQKDEIIASEVKIPEFKPEETIIYHNEPETKLPELKPEEVIIYHDEPQEEENKDGIIIAQEATSKEQTPVEVTQEQRSPLELAMLKALGFVAESINLNNIDTMGFTCVIENNKMTLTDINTKSTSGISMHIDSIEADIQQKE